MPVLRSALWLALAALLSGCALSDEVLFKTFTGEDPATESEMEAAEAVRGLGRPAPGMQQTAFRPPQITAGETSNTEAGRRIAGIRAEAVDLQRALEGRDDELQHLRRSYTNHASQYAGAVNAMGLEPGDPMPANDAGFQADIERMRGALARMQGDLLKLNSLAARVAVDAATANQLIQSAREVAARPDASAQDRQALSQMERELNGTVQTVHRMLSALHADIGAQTDYAASQRVRIDQLAAQVEEGVGDTLQPVAATPPARPAITAPTEPEPEPAPAEAEAEPAPTEGASPAPAAVSTPSQAPVELAGQRPFVTIRFDRPRVAYRQPLYEAIRAALERRPDAGFAVQGVTPRGQSAGSTAQHTAEVAQALEDMGLPPERIALATTQADDAPTDQVRIYAVAGDPAAVASAPALSEPAREAAGEPADVAAPSAPSGPSTARRPLVTIRFDRSDVDYEWPLYRAVEAALERRPEARFDLVSVGRVDSGGGAARSANARAEEVMLALTRMGLPADRITLATTTSQTVPADEVRLFVR